MLDAARDEVDLDVLLRDWSLTKSDLLEIQRARGQGRLWTASSSHYDPAHLARSYALVFWCLTVPETAAGRTPLWRVGYPRT